MTQNNQESRDESIQVASESIVRQRAGELIDDTVSSITRYINTVAGQHMVAESDNEIRRSLMGLLLAYEERSRNAG